MVPNVSPLLETLEIGAQLEKEATPYKLSDKTFPDTYTFREKIPVRIDREVEEDTSVMMAEECGMDPPLIPLMPPIDPLVRPRALPIVVPRRWICHPSSLNFMDLKLRNRLGTWRGTLRGWLVLL